MAGHASDNRAKVLLARKTNENPSLSEIIATAPPECQKKSKVAEDTPKNTFFLLVTAPRHSVSFLARFWDLICIELFLIYLYIFLRSLSHENQWFCIVFIAVKFFKKFTFKSQFFSDFQKFRKSMNFSKKNAFVTKFHFDVDLWVFDKKLQFFFSSESWDPALFRFFNVVWY